MQKTLQNLLTIVTAITITNSVHAQIGKVGINTTTPAAMLHVKDSSVLFSGGVWTAAIPQNPPGGPNVRLFWYPDKASFRCGLAYSTVWDKDSIGDFSFAAGYETKAKGIGSFAAGSGSQATQYGATAFGFSISKGLYSFSSASSTALGNYSFATGSSTALGDYSFAAGWNSGARGFYSSSFGYNTIAEGHNSIAVGDGSFAAGATSVAFGYSTKAKSYASLVVGRFNDTTSISSTTWNAADPVFVIGNGSGGSNRSNAFTVLKNGSTGINKANPSAPLHIVKGSTTGGPFNGNSAQIIQSNSHAFFQFSNSNFECGLLSGNESTDIRSAIIFKPDSSMYFRAGGNIDRISIAKSGFLGVGVSSPTHLLHVKKGISGGTGNSGSIGVFESNTNGYVSILTPASIESGILFANTASNAHGGIIYNSFATPDGIQFRNNGNLVQMVIDENGRVGIGTLSPTERLHVAGNICYTGSIGACSDIRYKKDFTLLENTLSKLDSINAFSYYWEEEKFPEMHFEEEKQLGVIAQEVQKVFPEIIMPNEEGYLSVDYSRLSVVLLSAVKEQQTLIEELQKQMILLNKEIVALKVEAVHRPATALPCATLRLPLTHPCTPAQCGAAQQPAKAEAK